jgi:hypothetical protein
MTESFTTPHPPSSPIILIATGRLEAELEDLVMSGAAEIGVILVDAPSASKPVG